ncbi:cytochrome P450 [Staphylotrichum tortipilum]|uniref:Cytochrome P450 n=1 Tax=Staphylotrichum tortipilum TaxID=2831512 RepID=A0AAN6MBL4_9PEZI|nr:cytochrome P450 [Staphylotrichum longicolle]
MLEVFLALSPLQTTALILGGLTILFISRRAYVDRRIRKLGGVRAPVLATNPVSGLPFFLKAGYFQTKDRLDHFYSHIFDWATPACPNCVEITFTGRIRFLMTREPEHIKTILTTKFREFGKGERFHDVWSPFLGDSIFTTDGQQWSESRALIRPMFVKDRVRDLHIFDRWATTLIERLPASGQTVDVMDLFYRMTLDVTTDFLLGGSVNSLNNPKHEFVAAFQEVQRIQMLLTIMAPFRYLIPTHRYTRGIRILERFISPFISRTLSLPPSELAKLSTSDHSSTFLHNLARCTRDAKTIRDQLMAVLIAGRDTTAATLSWTIYELAHYPRVYARLRAEVLAAVGTRRAPSYDDLKAMPYLTHTLNETLRLYPAVPYNLRAALQDTALPGRPGEPDIVVLEGDVVVYSTLAMQRRADLYPEMVAGGEGAERFPDPAVFCPDRWDGWTPKAWTYVPFNGGPRICVGQNFAMTEMAFTLVRLLQKYQRLEYRGDWHAQFHKAEIVGAPGHGVPVAFFEADEGEIA